MIRFFSVHNTPTEGTHLSLCWTSYKRTMSQAFEEIQKRMEAGGVARAPMFYDFGIGDSDLRRLDKIPGWAEIANIPGLQPSVGAAKTLGTCHA
ncbi:hypothetical protein AB4Y45_34585 [Paraburkholderia sp. EG287A]|uniref:hypothetical protein n=1 Tax=Paraburkholderia sp. EG287A TaxID=3237012 RepID=UPI0034D2F836